MQRLLVLIVLVVPIAISNDFGRPVCADDHAQASPESKFGVSVKNPSASSGYTLIAPLTSHDTYLIDLDGRVVQSWRNDCKPALSTYLLDDGSLLRAGALSPGEQPFGGP